MSCPRCGAAASSAARFCAECGLPLGAEVVAGRPALSEVEGSQQLTLAPPTSSGGWLTSSASISHGRFAPGTILDGRYRVIGLLGRGGMGEVYRADDLRLGQPVALKFLPEGVGRDPIRLAQFHNEVRMARQVSHPNICRVYDIGESEGQLFLSMEFVDGEDLATSLRRIGRFPEDKATDIARQLCAGLAAAHDRGVLHRDLKPANVMLDGTGKVRLMDFGLAAVGAVENVRMGTPAYMAPEQLLGREVTARSDIFSLGLVLYELFTGRRAFEAATLQELVERHQSTRLTPPRTVVPSIDPATERAILRCLDPDPARRPASPLAVSAALPGGDPLAAALAAGETPSPEMVAAAGEGTGLSRRVAVPLFAAVLVAIAATYMLTLASSPFARIQLEYTPDVLAQKARDAIRTIGYSDRPIDEAFGFDRDSDLIDSIGSDAKANGDGALFERPSAVFFWYRQSASALTGVQFHHDLLTPGIVTLDDPAPVMSGMIQLKLDHHGWLTYFEAIPPQREEAPIVTPPVDWRPLLALAGFDAASLQETEPQWNWLSAADTRVAWIGTWPGSGHALRVEGAALRGRPVGFLAAGPWTTPWRTESAAPGSAVAYALILLLLAVAILGGAVLLARTNLRHGRGDRAGALRLGSAVTVALWILWICQVHASASIPMIGTFLIAVCTTVFYGVVFWTIYLALEPFVRRHWPQTLVSWTTLLSGRIRDQIVGRDVLFGLALGVTIALFIRSVATLSPDPTDWPPIDLLLGVRSTAGEVVGGAVNAMRSALIMFFLLVLLRVFLRNKWVAALAFVGIFVALNALPSRQPWIDGAQTFVYFSMLAVAVVHWGLTSIAVAIFVANLLLMVPATRDLSAWYAGQTLLVVAIPVAIASWAFYTAIGGRLGTADLFERA